MNHPDDIALIISTGNTTTALPDNTGLSDNFKVTLFLADSYKKHVKRDASLFNTFKEGNIEMIGTGTPLPLLEHRT